MVDLITADRTIFNEGSEIKARSSKLDRGTIFGYSMDSVVPVENENFSGDGKRIYGNFSSRLKSRKSFTLTIKWNLDQITEDLSWKHRTSTPHRSETNGIAVRKLREGTSAVLLQSCLDEKCWLVLRNAVAICEMLKTSVQMRRHFMRDDLENH